MDRRTDDQVQMRSAQTERQQSSRNSSRMNQARAARRRRVMRNRIIFGAIVLLILLGIIFSIRGCAKHHQAKVKAKQEAQQKKSTDPAEEARKKAVKAAKKRENPLTEDTGDILMIVNKEYGLSEEYKPNDLTKVEHCDFSVGSDECHQLKKEPAEAIEEMFAAAREDGYEIIMRTGYRSYGYQAALYESYKEKDGEEAADKYSARPGSSEHQSGLCCDVGIEGKDLISVNKKPINPDGPKATLGPGTGLGVGYLTKQDGDEYYLVSASEGSHGDFAPRNKLQFKFMKYLQRYYGVEHISTERATCGQSIIPIYKFLSEETNYTYDFPLYEQVQVFQAS